MADKKQAKGFYDKFGQMSQYLRICERLGGFDEVSIG